MSRKKTISVIFITVLFIIGIISILLYKIGDRILDEIIEQQIAALEQESGLTVPDPAPVTPAAEAIPTAPAPVSPAPTQSGQKGEEAAIPAPAPQAPKENGSPGPAKAPQVTAEDLTKLKNEVNPVDKMTIAGMVFKRLSQDDINKLTGLSAGGLTKDEETQAKQIVLSRFTPDEIETIRELYYKYMR